MTTRALFPQEIALLEQTLAKQNRYRDRLFVLLAVSTGFRLIELLSLRIRQVLAAGGEVAREITIERRSLKGGRGPMRNQSALVEWISTNAPVRRSSILCFPCRSTRAR